MNLKEILKYFCKYDCKLIKDKSTDLDSIAINMNPDGLKYHTKDNNIMVFINLNEDSTIKIVVDIDEYYCNSYCGMIPAMLLLNNKFNINNKKDIKIVISYINICKKVIKEIEDTQEKIEKLVMDKI